MSKLPKSLALALVGAGFALSAQAQNPPADIKSNPPGAAAQQGSAARANDHRVPEADRQFAEKAAMAGMEEVELGKLAQQKAQAADVKQFGERMVHDHTQANEKLKQIAFAESIDLPSKFDHKADKDMDKLQKLSGAAFDRAYIKAQASDHQKVVKEFRKEAKSGKDSQLRDFAQSTLPTLEEHLKLAQSAQQELGKSASGSDTTSSGLASAKKATGASRADAEKQAGMPIAKTGM